MVVDAALPMTGLEVVMEPPDGAPCLCGSTHA